MARTARIAVIGGGITGLAAARAINAAGHTATVFEGTGRVGGALRSSEVAGVVVDEGADAFLVRVPAARVLAATVSAPLVHPAARSADVLVGDTLRPLPRSVLGVPLDLRQARAVLGPAGVARAAADLVLPASAYSGDVSVGAQLRKRLGAAVLDRLVEPLLGGVYAGHADDLSMAMALPQLFDPTGSSVLRRAREVTPKPTDAPVFASLAAGLGSFPAMVADGLEVRLDTRVTGLVQTAEGYALEIGSRHEQPARETFDAVVLAVPAAAARRLLDGVAPTAAGLAGATDYASVAIVTLAWPRPLAGLLRDATRSGWLVPPHPERVVKAVTVSTSKWAHLREGAPDLVIVRASVGRYAEERDLQREDRELVGVVAAEVARTGRVTARHVASRVTRWGGALPQYTVGHLDRVARLRERLPAGLAVAGAAYDGVGIPACIASGERAAASLAQWVGGRE